MEPRTGRLHRGLLSLMGLAGRPFLAATMSLLASCAVSPGSDIGALGPIPPLSSSGRWLTDATGRVVVLHGFNEVAKSPPFYPAAFGFGDDDVAFLEQEGFNAVRLGVEFQGLMPVPGQVDESYIEHLAESVDALARHRLFVLLEFHQDGFGPFFRGNGFPDWMAITDRLPNPPEATFPLFYVQNPALQRAFEHFWANSPGPNRIGLQEYFVQGLERLVRRFSPNPWVLGYELMNEPWPGANWEPCLLPDVGCPELEHALLMPFYQRAAAAARRIAPNQLVFVEPFVLFNFGRSETTLPGFASGTALSFHSYASDVAGEESVLARAVAAAERDQAPVLVTEFGSTLDPVELNRLAGQIESRRLSWLEWAYNESIIEDPLRPAGPDNLRSREAFAALVRPYPMAVAGTPTTIAFDPTTKMFVLTYDTVRPGGGRYSARLLTVVSVPERHYPGGYTVRVEGATVVSAACASRLVLRNQPDARTVSLRLTPGDRACPA